MAKPDTFKTMRQYVFHFADEDEFSVVLEPHHKAEYGHGAYHFDQDGRETWVYAEHVKWVEQSEFQLKEREQ